MVHGTSKGLLTAGVRKITQAPVVDRNQSIRRFLKQEDIPQSREVRDLLTILFDASKVSANFGRPSYDPHHFVSEGFERARQSYHTTSPGTPDVTGASPTRIRAKLQQISQDERRELYRKLHSGPLSYMLGTLDDALLQGKNIPQDQLREVFCVRLLNWAPASIVQVIEPLLEEWTIDLKPPYTRIATMPAQYSAETVERVRQAIHSTRLTEVDFTPLSFMLVRLGANIHDAGNATMFVNAIQQSVIDASTPSEAPRMERKQKPATPPRQAPSQRESKKEEPRRAEKEPDRALSQESLRYFQKTMGMLEAGEPDRALTKSARYSLEWAEQTLQSEDSPVARSLKNALEAGAATSQNQQRDRFGRLRESTPQVSNFVHTLYEELLRGQFFEMRETVPDNIIESAEEHMREFLAYLATVSSMITAAVRKHEHAGGGDVVLEAAKDVQIGLMVNFIQSTKETTTGRKRPESIAELYWKGFLVALSTLHKRVIAMDRADPVTIALDDVLKATPNTTVQLLEAAEQEESKKQNHRGSVTPLPKDFPLATFLRLPEPSVNGADGKKDERVSFASHEPQGFHQILIGKGTPLNTTFMLTQPHAGAVPALPHSMIPLDTMLPRTGAPVAAAYRHAAEGNRMLQEVAGGATRAGIAPLYTAFAKNNAMLTMIEVNGHGPQIPPERFFVFQKDLLEPLGLQGTPGLQPVDAQLRERLSQAMTVKDTPLVMLPVPPPPPVNEAQNGLSDQEVNHRVHAFIAKNFPTEVPLDVAERFLAMAGIVHEPIRSGGHSYMRDPKTGGQYPLSHEENTVQKAVLKSHIQKCLFKSIGAFPPLGDKRELLKKIEAGLRYAEI